MADTDPTHDRLARLLDLTIASVSRIRTGQRRPSIDAMVRIEALFDWRVSDQVVARGADLYATRFNEKAAEWAAKHPVESPEPATNGS
jgi:transcriptional regulator with XRE-family HTH domain